MPETNVSTAVGWEEKFPVYENGKKVGTRRFTVMVTTDNVSGNTYVTLSSDYYPKSR